MKIEKRGGWKLHDGSDVINYDVDGWTMEVIIYPDGHVDMDEGDANHKRALRNVKVWQAWAEFAKQKNKEGWL